MYFDQNGKQHLLDPQMVDLSSAYEYCGGVNFPCKRCDLIQEEGMCIQETGLTTFADSTDTVLFYIMGERICEEDTAGEKEEDCEFFDMGGIPEYFNRLLEEKTRNILKFT